MNRRGRGGVALVLILAGILALVFGVSKTFAVREENAMIDHHLQKTIALSERMKTEGITEDTEAEFEQYDLFAKDLMLSVASKRRAARWGIGVGVLLCFGGVVMLRKRRSF